MSIWLSGYKGRNNISCALHPQKDFQGFPAARLLHRRLEPPMAPAPASAPAAGTATAQLEKNDFPSLPNFKVRRGQLFNKAVCLWAVKGSRERGCSCVTVLLQQDRM